MWAEYISVYGGGYIACLVHGSSIFGAGMLHLVNEDGYISCVLSLFGYIIRQPCWAFADSV